VSFYGLCYQKAAKLGAEVTCISTSPRKIDEAKQLGATHFYNINDASQHAGYESYFDVIINTASGGSDQVTQHLKMLAPFGVLCLLGIPEEQMTLSAIQFVGMQRSVTGSMVGSIETINEMFAFAAKHSIKPWIQVMAMEKANEGIQLVKDNKAKYRIVLKN
jgi:D-arabinose 1-dehydrogenase-like Zn-dependent alcohol dehydrogenase